MKLGFPKIMQDVDIKSVIERFKKTGIVRLQGLLTPDEVSELRSNGFCLKSKFHHTYGTTSPIKTRGGWRLDIPPVNLIRKNGASLASAVGTLVSNPIFQQVCGAILGKHWCVTALVFDYREPTNEPMPPNKYTSGYPPAYYWHVDHGIAGCNLPDIFTLRFQVYLNDTNIEQGALGYGANTHRLVKHIRSQLKNALPNKIEIPIIDTLESLISAKNLLANLNLSLNPEFEKLFSKFIKAVPNCKEETNEMIYGGSAGTILMFDDTGMHRGNFVRSDHRYVCRLLCSPRHSIRQYKDWAIVKNSLARYFYRMTLNEPFKYLI